MKELLLIRHAKSSWKDPYLRDFDRPLNERGKNDAPVMADRTFNREGSTDLLLSSPAKRAHLTAFEFHKKFGNDIVFDENIYEASYKTLLEVINHLSDDYERVMMFGHNPGFSHIMDYLTSKVQHMPTCGIAKISFEADRWAEISADSGLLVYFDYPKNTNSI